MERNKVGIPPRDTEWNEGAKLRLTLINYLLGDNIWNHNNTADRNTGGMGR